MGMGEAEFKANSFEPTGYTQSQRSDVITGVIYLIYIIKIFLEKTKAFIHYFASWLIRYG